MKKMIPPLVGLLAVLAIGTASASDDCNVPEAEWQPKEALQAKLIEQGWTIESIEIDDGCYEAYGTTDMGEKVEAYFNPKTFELIKTE